MDLELLKLIVVYKETVVLCNTQVYSPHRSWVYSLIFVPSRYLPSFITANKERNRRKNSHGFHIRRPFGAYRACAFSQSYNICSLYNVL